MEAPAMERVRQRSAPSGQPFPFGDLPDSAAQLVALYAARNGDLKSLALASWSCRNAASSPAVWAQLLKDRFGRELPIGPQPLDIDGYTCLPGFACVAVTSQPVRDMPADAAAFAVTAEGSYIAMAHVPRDLLPPCARWLAPTWSKDAPCMPAVYVKKGEVVSKQLPRHPVGGAHQLQCLALGRHMGFLACESSRSIDYVDNDQPYLVRVADPGSFSPRPVKLAYVWWLHMDTVLPGVLPGDYVMTWRMKVLPRACAPKPFTVEACVKAAYDLATRAPVPELPAGGGYLLQDVKVALHELRRLQEQAGPGQWFEYQAGVLHVPPGVAYDINAIMHEYDSSRRKEGLIWDCVQLRRVV